MSLAMRNRVKPWKFDCARRMRLAPTEAEARLWTMLRGKSEGVRFRRQSILYGWIVDFWCPSRRIAVEADGSIHEKPDQMAADAHRDQCLMRHGIRVLRLSNGEILNRPMTALEKIREAIGSLIG